jgi:AraC family transcriptional regulator, glycine betaine-responsive activator
MTKMNLSAPLGSSPPKPTHVAIILLPRFTLLGPGCIVDTLRLANRAVGHEVYSWSIVGLEPTIMSSSLITLNADRTIDDIASLTPDAVIVCGGLEGHRYVNRRVLSWLRDLDIRGAITGAVSTGIWSLAEARLLDGRRCAVHWDDIPSFSVRFPLVDVRRDIFAQDGRRVTCSGGTAAIDMMLHLLKLQHSKALADDVAELLIHGRTRAGADKQRRSADAEPSVPRPLRCAIALMQDHVEPTLSIDALAGRLGLSTRRLERLFGGAFGMPPKRYYDLIRLHRARKLLVETDLPITEVALRCGYLSPTQFSARFHKSFGLSPRRQRQEGLS